MNRVLSVCPAPKCPRLTTGGRCDPHQLELDQAANARKNARAIRAIYDDPRWPITRQVVLARDDFTCVTCGHRDVSGTTLDCAHKTSIGEVIATGGNPFDPNECVAKCQPCHGRADAPRASTSGCSW